MMLGRSVFIKDIYVQMMPYNASKMEMKSIYMSMYIYIYAHTFIDIHHFILLHITQLKHWFLSPTGLCGSECSDIRGPIQAACQSAPAHHCCQHSSKVYFLEYLYFLYSQNPKNSFTELNCLSFLCILFNQINPIPLN